MLAHYSANHYDVAVLFRRDGQIDGLATRGVGRRFVRAARRKNRRSCSSASNDIADMSS